MNLFLNKKIPPTPPLRKWGNNKVLFSRGLDTFPSLVKRGKGRFSKHNKKYLFIPSHPTLKKVWRLRDGDGFTLIEVLIAVAILSIVLAAVYSTFFLSHRAIDGMDESMLKLQESRRALDILKRELDSAYVDIEDEQTQLKILDRDIYGKQASQLTVTAFSPLRPGVSKISYYVEDKDKKLVLFKKLESPYKKEETEGVDIIEDLEEFTLEARYNDSWVRTWDTGVNKDMPYEIKITLTMLVKGRKITLSDIARPKFGKPV